MHRGQRPSGTQASRHRMLADAVESRGYTGFTGHTQERNVRVVAFGIKVALDAFALVPVRINGLAFGEIFNRQKFAGTEVGTVNLTAFIITLKESPTATPLFTSIDVLSLSLI